MPASTIGVVATILSSVAFVPQVIKNTWSGHTQDQSLILYVLLVVAGAFWYAYGVESGNQILQVSATVQIGLLSCVLLLKLSNVLGGVDTWMAL